MKPIYDRIIVEKIWQEDKTASGIIIPEQAKEKPMRSVVVAVGPGRLLDNGEIRPLMIKVGDTILMGKYVGSDFTLDGRKLTIVKEDDVLSILEAGE